jgi:hypothetical protein
MVCHRSEPKMRSSFRRGSVFGVRQITKMLPESRAPLVSKEQRFAARKRPGIQSRQNLRQPIGEFTPSDLRCKRNGSPSLDLQRS